jgi:hypothetical protein
MYGGRQRLMGPATMYAPGNTPTGFGMTPEFVGSDDFATSLKASAVQSAGILDGTRLTAQNITSMADEIAPYTNQIASTLKETMLSLESAGTPAKHISEVFKAAEPRISKTLQEMTSAGGSLPSAAEGIRRLAYATEEDIVSGGYARVNAAKVNPETGAIYKGVTSYKDLGGFAGSYDRGLKKVAETVGLDTAGMTKAHVLPEDGPAIMGSETPMRGGAMKLGDSITGPVEQKIREKNQSYLDAGAKIVENADSQIAEGAAKKTKTASPSKVTQQVGADIGQGAINGLTSKIDDAVKAGEQLGQATVDGTQATTRTLGKREPRRAQTLPDGTIQKTTPQGTSILIPGADPTKRDRPDPENPGQRVSQVDLDHRAAIEEDKQRTKASRRAEAERRLANLKKSRSIGGRFSSAVGAIAGGVKAASSAVGGAIAKGGMGAGMGLSMAGMGVSMIPGLQEVGMAISIIGPMFMMMSVKVLAIVAALGLLGFGIYKLIEEQEKQKQAAIDLGNAQVMSMDKLNSMGEDFGTVSATEARIAAEDAAAAGVSTKRLSEGQQYLQEAASGQQIVADVKTQQAAGLSSEEIGKNVAADMATAVAQGVVSQKQATTIIAALGSIVGDRAITAGASQQFGTYMEDPTKASGMVASDRFTRLRTEFSTATEGLNTKGLAGSGFTRFGAATGNVSNEALGAVAGTMNAYGQAQGGIDAINAQYDALVKEATTRKEINDLEAKRTADLTTQRNLSSSIYDQLEKQKATIGAVKFNEAFLKSFDQDSEAYKTAQEINKIQDSEFKTQFQADFAGGNMSQATAERLIAAGGKAIKTYYTMKASVDLSKEDQRKLNALALINPKALAALDKQNKPPKGDKPPKDEEEDTAGGGGGGEPEDKKLTALTNKLDKRQKAMAVISLREAAINKKYEERKKALEDIARINGQIAEQQKGQLDIANALASGDIAAAARAVQAERARSAAFAQEQQMKALDEQRQSEIDNLSIGGKSRKSLQEIIDKLAMQIAMRQYKTASSGGMMKGYSVGGKVMSYFAAGGKPLGSDTIPAMLTPGEFVIKRPAVKNFGVKNLEKINNGNNPSSGVYNYNVNVNVATGSDPDKIARTVVTKIRSIDKQRLGGNVY